MRKSLKNIFIAIVFCLSILANTPNTASADGQKLIYCYSGLGYDTVEMGVGDLSFAAYAIYWENAPAGADCSLAVGGNDSVSITFESSNSNVVKVFSNGAIEATGPGTAVVSATYNDLRDTIVVTVRGAGGELPPPPLTTPPSNYGTLKICSDGAGALSEPFEGFVGGSSGFKLYLWYESGKNCGDLGGFDVTHFASWRTSSSYVFTIDVSTSSGYTTVYATGKNSGTAQIQASYQSKITTSWEMSYRKFPPTVLICSAVDSSRGYADLIEGESAYVIVKYLATPSPYTTCAEHGTDVTIGSTFTVSGSLVTLGPRDSGIVKAKVGAGSGNNTVYVSAPRSGDYLNTSFSVRVSKKPTGTISGFSAAETTPAGSYEIKWQPQSGHTYKLRVREIGEDAFHIIQITSPFTEQGRYTVSGLDPDKAFEFSLMSLSGNVPYAVTNWSETDAGLPDDTSTGAVKLCPNDLTVKPGEVKNLSLLYFPTLTSEPSDCTNLPAVMTENVRQAASWISSNSAVATVIGGDVTARKDGTATIEASYTYNGKVYKDSVTVTVKTTMDPGDPPPEGGDVCPANPPRSVASGLLLPDATKNLGTMVPGLSGAKLNSALNIMNLTLRYDRIAAGAEQRGNSLFALELRTLLDRLVNTTITSLSDPDCPGPIDGGGNTPTGEINLTRDGVTTAVGTLMEGHNAVFQNRVKNTGTKASNQKFSSTFKYCWGPDCTPNLLLQKLVHLDPVPAQGTGDYQVTNSVIFDDAGTYRVQYCIDSDAEITESNEGDNCSTSGFTIAPKSGGGGGGGGGGKTQLN